MKFKIKSNIKDAIKYAKQLDRRISAVQSHLLRHLSLRFLQALKANIPEGKIEDIYKDGLYLGRVFPVQGADTAFAVALKDDAKEIDIDSPTLADIKAYVDPWQVVVSFPYAVAETIRDRVSASWLANSIASTWTFDTLPPIGTAYKGPAVLKLVSADEHDGVQDARTSGTKWAGMSDEQFLLKRLKEEGYDVTRTVGGVADFSGVEYLLDMAYFALRLERGHPHWIKAVNKTVSSDRVIMSIWKSSAVYIPAMRMLTRFKDRSWKKPPGLNLPLIDEDELPAFNKFARYFYRVKDKNIGDVLD